MRDSNFWQWPKWGFEQRRTALRYRAGRIIGTEGLQTKSEINWVQNLCWAFREGGGFQLHHLSQHADCLWIDVSEKDYGRQNEFFREWLLIKCMILKDILNEKAKLHETK